MTLFFNNSSRILGIYEYGARNSKYQLNLLKHIKSKISKCLSELLVNERKHLELVDTFSKTITRHGFLKFLYEP